MGKRKAEVKVFQCRLTPRLYERALDSAGYEGISFSEFVRTALREACTRREQLWGDLDWSAVAARRMNRTGEKPYDDGEADE